MSEIKTYVRRPITVEAICLDKGSYSEAMMFIEDAGRAVDPNVKAFVGIITDDGSTIPAHHGDYLVTDGRGNLFVFDPEAFAANFSEKKL